MICCVTPVEMVIYGIVHTAPDTGMLTREVRDIAMTEHRMTSRATIYRAIKTLREKGLIRNVGTERVERYSPAANTVL